MLVDLINGVAFEDNLNGLNGDEWIIAEADHGTQVAGDASIGLADFEERAEASDDFWFDFRHRDLLFTGIIGEANISVLSAASHFVYVFDEALIPVVSVKLFDSSAFAVWRWRQRCSFQFIGREDAAIVRRQLAASRFG